MQGILRRPGELLFCQAGLLNYGISLLQNFKGVWPANWLLTGRQQGHSMDAAFNLLLDMV